MQCLFWLNWSSRKVQLPALINRRTAGVKRKHFQAIYMALISNSFFVEFGPKTVRFAAPASMTSTRSALSRHSPRKPSQRDSSGKWRLLIINVFGRVHHELSCSSFGCKLCRLVIQLIERSVCHNFFKVQGTHTSNARSSKKLKNIPLHGNLNLGQL